MTDVDGAKILSRAIFVDMKNESFKRWEFLRAHKNNYFAALDRAQSSEKHNNISLVG